MLSICASCIMLLISNSDSCRTALYNKVLEDTTFDRSFFIKLKVVLPDKTKYEIVTTNYFLYSYVKRKKNISYGEYKKYFLTHLSNSIPINIDSANCFFYTIVDSNSPQIKKIASKGRDYFLTNYVENYMVRLNKLNGLNEFEAYSILWDMNIGVRWGADEAFPYINFNCK